jgi:hypothetical protein
MWRIVKAALVYFALVFAAGFALGVIRVPLLLPRLGERAAELIEAPFMLLAIVLAARHVVFRHLADAAIPGLLAVGALALMLLVSVEFSVVLRIRDLSLETYFRGRDPIAGGVYVALLVVFAAMPLAVASWRRRREP